MEKKQLKAEGFLVILTIIWGGTFAVIKTGLNDSTPLMLISVRFGAAFLIFTLLYFKKFSFNGKKTIYRGLILGVLMFLGYGLQTLGLNYTTASRAGFITYTYALFIPFLQFYVLKRKPVLGNIVGLLVVFGGLWIISNPMGGDLNIGDLITFGAAISYAFYIIFLDKITKEENPALMTAIQFLVTAILGLITSLFLEDPFIKFSPNLIYSILYLVILGSVVSIYLMNLYQRDTTPMRAVLIYSLEPVFAVLFALVILKESFSFREIVGSVLILLGVLVSELWEFVRFGKKR